MLVVILIKNIAIALLSALDFALFGRAILSWINPMGEGALASFLYAVTEPIILPFRKLFQKLHWFEGSPLDMAFFFAMISIMILQSLLEILL